MRLEKLISVWKPIRHLPGGGDLKRSRKFADALLRWLETGPNAADAFEKRTGADLLGWLFEFISSVNAEGHVDEAIRYSRRFDRFWSIENFHGDVVMYLSAAGRHERALAEAERLLERFPGVAWAQIFAADAFVAAGVDDRAESLFRKALELADGDEYTIEGVLERFVPWLRERGRGEEARRVQELGRADRSTSSA